MKHTLLIIALLWALEASGQIYINSFTFGAAPAATLLLDDYPNAAAAYSLRLLRTAYTGNCIEVRRSSDNTTSNIGFSGGVIDTATLKTFCAGTDCFVRTWYDQSGNTNNATQTTNGNQPKIVTSGVIEYENGKPTMRFDASDDFFTLTSSITGASSQSDFSVAGRATTTTSTIINCSTSGSHRTNEILTTGRAVYRNSSTAAATAATSYTGVGQTLIGCVYTSNTASYIINQTSFTLSYTFGTANIFDAIGRRASVYHDGTMQETIRYTSDQTSNRTGIESNINSFYNIY